MSRALAKSWLRSVILSLLPATAFAQSAITGVVKDATGAVLVGVSVEAASDALIERVRAAVTDSQGVYRIVDLRPGTYAVTFSLQGFRGSNARIRNAVRVHGHRQRRTRPGPLEDVVTVTAGSPMVDTTTAVHTRWSTARRSTRFPPAAPFKARPAHRRHQPEPARHRGARAMQQTYMTTHGVHRQQYGDGGRHAGERAAARPRRAELLQRRDEPGSELPDERHRAHGRRRRAPTT